MKTGLHLSTKKTLILSNNFQPYLSQSFLQANFFNSNFINYNNKLLMLYDSIIQKQNKTKKTISESTDIINKFEV